MAETRYTPKAKSRGIIFEYAKIDNATAIEIRTIRSILPTFFFIRILFKVYLTSSPCGSLAPGGLVPCKVKIYEDTF